MTSSIPEPLRAVAGLAAMAIDETRDLPRVLTSLPVVAIGAAMQASLRVRQTYAGLVARGDELLTQLGAGNDGTPPWARFDEDDEDHEDHEDGAATPAASATGNGAGPDRGPADTVGNRRSRFDTQPDTPSDGPADLDADLDPDLDAFAEPGDAPVAGYDGFSLAQLRARLRRYDADTLRRLVDYERAGAARPAYLTMLENRLATLDRS